MNTNHYDNRPLPNGDPGGDDKFDGGCPSDTIRAQVATIAEDRAVYAVLIVWPKTGVSEVFSWGDGSRGDNEKRIAAWNRANNAGIAYLVRIPLPERTK